MFAIKKAADAADPGSVFDCQLSGDFAGSDAHARGAVVDEAGKPLAVRDAGESAPRGEFIFSGSGRCLLPVFPQHFHADAAAH